MKPIHEARVVLQKRCPALKVKNTILQNTRLQRTLGLLLIITSEILLPIACTKQFNLLRSYVNYFLWNDENVPISRTCDKLWEKC